MYGGFATTTWYVPYFEDVAGLDVVVYVLGAVRPCAGLAAEVELALAARRALAVQQRVADRDVDREVDAARSAAPRRRRASRPASGGTGRSPPRTGSCPRRGQTTGPWRPARTCQSWATPSPTPTAGGGTRPAGSARLPQAGSMTRRPCGRSSWPCGRCGFQAELLDRRVERVVEDELLDELGRLEQRVGLPRGFGQVLVEVAEEAGVPLGVGEVVADLAVLAGLPPEVEQRLDRVRRWAGSSTSGCGGGRTGPPLPGRRTGPRTRPRASRGRRSPGGSRRTSAGGRAQRGLDAIARAGDERVLDQAVVLAEADEDGGEDPGDGDLGDPLPQPGLEGGGGAVGGLRGAPLDLEPRSLARPVGFRSASSRATCFWSALRQQGPSGRSRGLQVLPAIIAVRRTRRARRAARRRRGSR